MKKRIASIFTVLTMLLMLVPAGVFAESDPISYLDEKGISQVCNDYTEINLRSEELTSGWYVVKDTVITTKLIVEGEVHLILTNGSSLTVNSSVRVNAGNKFTVYCQSKNLNEMGKLTAKAINYNAAIGGYNSNNCGTITINGGIINAIPNSSGAAAGIGGGGSGSGGTITINGGQVTAYGSQYGAAIGGGSGPESNMGASCGNITINGGTVEAKVESNGQGAAIGSGARYSGDEGSITIKGGTVNATSSGTGAAIGGGHLTSGGTITIIDGNVTATHTGSTKQGAAIGGGQAGSGGNITIKGGQVTANTESLGAAIGGDSSYPAGTIIIKGGTVTATSTGNGAAIGSVANDSTVTIAPQTGHYIAVNSGINETTASDIAGSPFYLNSAEIQSLIAASKYVSCETGKATIYTITLNPNGGTGSPTSANTNLYGKLTTLPDPVRDGYTFVGWYTATVDGDKVTTETEFTENTTIYAHWLSQNTGVTSVTVSGTTGTVNGTNITVVLPKGTAALPTDQSEINIVPADGAKVSELTTADNGSTWTFTVTAKDGTEQKYTIHVSIEIETFTVTVQNDGNGTASASPTPAPENTTITLNATPNTGYQFKEWQVISGGVTIENNKFIMPAANVTIKAVFEPIPPVVEEYLVTFDANGGTASVTSATTSGGKLESLPDAFRTGYIFTGWYTENGDLVTVDTVFTKDTTLYAGWRFIPVYVPDIPSYNPGGSSSGSTSGGNTSSGTVKPSEPEFEWVRRDGYTYLYVDSRMMTGWYQEENGDWYWFDEDTGIMSEDCWEKIDNVWYAFDDFGVMLTGWQEIDGKWYYLKDWGGMATGWQLIDGVWYYLRSDGSMAANAWVQTNGQWYYLTGSGAMATARWVEWKGDWYYLYSSGIMATNATIDGYYVNSNGVWVQ